MSDIEDLKERVEDALKMLPTRVEWVDRRGEINIFSESDIGQKTVFAITEYHLGLDDWGLIGSWDDALSALRPIAQRYGCDVSPGPGNSISFRKTS